MKRATDLLVAQVMGHFKLGEFPDHSRFGVLNPGKIMIDPPGGPLQEYDDPRESTDMALQILGWLYTHYDVDTMIDQVPGKEATWSLGICRNEPEVGRGDTDYYEIPLSGKAFRYAVLKMAGQVLYRSV